MTAGLGLYCVLGFSCLVSAAVLEAAPNLDAVLPVDTGVTVFVRDVSDFKTQWPQSPLGRLWRDPALQEKPDGDDPMTLGRVHRATGLGLAQILDRFEDEAALCAPDLKALVSPDGPWAVAAVSADVRTWRTLAADLAEHRGAPGGQADIPAEENPGEPVGGLLPAAGETPELAWGWHDGVGFLGSPASYVDALMASRAAAEGHLDTSDLWRKFAGEPSDLRIYIDLGGLTELLTDWITSSESADSSAAAFMGISPAQLVKALGLEAFHGALAQARLEPDATLVDFRILVDDAPGLSRLIAYREGPCERPEIIPAEAIHASVSRFQISAFWRAFLELLEEIQPGLSSVVVYQIGTLTAASGLDFEKDVLGQLRDDTFVAYLPPREAITDTAAWMGLDQLSGVRVQDPEKMETTMAWLLAGSPMTQAGQAETREIEGVSVHSFKLGPAENSPAFSYAFRDSLLLVSSGPSDIIGRALTATRKPGGSFWDRPDVTSLLKFVPKEAATLGYWDPQGFEEMLPPVPASDEGDPAGDSQGKGDGARALVGAMARHLGPVVTYSLKTPSEYFTRVRITRPKP